MPLIKGKSQKSFVKNLKTEMEAGKPQKQSLAIAYAMKRKADKRKKMADGGDPASEAEGSMPAVQSAPAKSSSGGGGGGGIMKLAALAAKGGEMKVLQGKEMYPHSKNKMFDVTNKYADGDEVEAPADASQNPEDQEKAKSLYDPDKATQLSGSFKKAYADGGPVLNQQGVQSLASAFGNNKAKGGEMEGNDKLKEAYKMAKGGFIGSHQSKGMGHTNPDIADHEMDKGYMSHPGNDVQPNEPAHDEDDKDLNQHPVDMNAETDIAEQDLVDRIMHKMSQNFSSLARLSQGGMVANQEHGENNNEMAGFSPNEFDDLVLRDDLESSYGDDDNAGDSLDNEQENEDRKDIVARIMASRKKKDKLPNPA